MSRASRVAALNPEPSYTVSRAAALNALQKLHPPAVAVTREGVLTRCYVLGLSPPQAAEHGPARRRQHPATLMAEEEVGEPIGGPLVLCHAGKKLHDLTAASKKSS